MANSRIATSSITQGFPKSKSLLTGNDAIFAGSYESIETVTVGSGGASTVTFSSIPSTYTHLQIRIFSRDSRVAGNSDSSMRFNADTAANYSDHNISGDGGTLFVGAGTSVTNMNIGNQPALNTTASVFGSRVIDILDYANTNKYKTMRCLSGYDANGGGWVMLSSGSWRNTAAITSITFIPLVAPYVQYSSFALYGIK